MELLDNNYPFLNNNNNNNTAGTPPLHRTENSNQADIVVGEINPNVFNNNGQQSSALSSLMNSQLLPSLVRGVPSSSKMSDNVANDSPYFLPSTIKQPQPGYSKT